MTLLRQLTALLLLGLTLLAAALLLIGITQQHRLLQQQLALAAHDAATALAASATLAAPGSTTAQREALLTLIFDNGDFEQITVEVRGAAPLQRRVSPLPTDVPAWFGKQFHFAPARAQADILAATAGIASNTGDNGTVGKISVIGAADSALKMLWESSVELAVWGMMAWFALVVLVLVVLHFLLRPLRAMVRQAEAISDREYPLLRSLPQQRELRSVAVAMNRISSKMQTMFAAHADAMNRLRAESYRDSLTGLANRRYFDMHLQCLLSAVDEFNSGALLLISLSDFNRVNQQFGFAAGDELLRSVAHALEQSISGEAEPDYFIARLSGATFALLLSNVGEREAMESGARIAAALQGMHAPGLLDTREIGHIGIAMYRRQSATQFLAEADTALRTAQSKGPHALHMHEARGDSTVGFSVTRWAEFLRDVIEKKNIILHLQPVLDSANHRTILQYETLLRVVGEDGQLIPAVQFLPMAKRLGLIQQIDRLVVTEVLARIRQDRYGRVTIAVNLFPATVRQPGFTAWLAAALKADPNVAKRVAFEISEQGALDHLDALHELVSAVRQHGAQFGLDHFSRGFASFGYLASLKVDYLKIDGSFVRGIAQNRDNQFLVDSICKIAQGLDLQVIAESVESDEDWAMLTVLGIDGVQGYSVGVPSEI